MTDHLPMWLQILWPIVSAIVLPIGGFVWIMYFTKSHLVPGKRMAKETVMLMTDLQSKIAPIILDLTTVIKEVRVAVHEVSARIPDFKADFEKLYLPKAREQLQILIRDGTTEAERFILERIDRALGETFGHEGGNSDEQTPIQKD